MMQGQVVVFHRRQVPVGLFVAVGIALVMACSSDDTDDEGVDDNQFRSDVFACEDAVAHLNACCGTTFDRTDVECHHLFVEDPGCGSDQPVSRQDPDFSEDESDCIRGQSCEALRTNDICGRATRRGLALNAGEVVVVDGGGASPLASVCP